MHPELEGLLRAYDAAREANGPDAAGLRDVFQSRLDEALGRNPHIKRETMMNLVRIAHARWLRAQQKTSTLPPAA